MVGGLEMYSIPFQWLEMNCKWSICKTFFPVTKDHKIYLEKRIKLQCDKKHFLPWKCGFSLFLRLSKSESSLRRS